MWDVCTLLVLQWVHATTNHSYLIQVKTTLTHYMLHVALMAFAPSLAFLSFNISFNLYHILLNYILLITLDYHILLLSYILNFWLSEHCMSTCIYRLTSAPLLGIELRRVLGLIEIRCFAASLVKVCVSRLTVDKSKSMLLGSTKQARTVSILPSLYTSWSLVMF